MLRQNMDRSVITYSSLISACEKAGQWDTALRVFAEMQVCAFVCVCAGGTHGGGEGGDGTSTCCCHALGYWKCSYPTRPPEGEGVAVIRLGLCFASCPLPTLYRPTVALPTLSHPSHLVLTTHTLQADGCAPNTVTFNSLITACAQGGCGRVRDNVWTVLDRMWTVWEYNPRPCCLLDTAYDPTLLSYRPPQDTSPTLPHTRTSHLLPLRRQPMGACQRGV